jgi:NTP pyrophosphatase (non-canonical NTP hydrolase)
MNNIPDIAESRAIRLFNEHFSNNLSTRYDKLMEEIKELDEAIKEYENKKTPETLAHLFDELSDVQGVFTHLASLVGLYQREMLNSCIDKVKGRMIDPNYRR